MNKNKSLTNTLLENENIQKLIKKVSGIFYKMKETDIKELEIEILEEIIRNEELKIEDEDSLMNKIMNFYETDHSYSYLFEYVIFNNLSKSRLEQFINEFDYTDLTHNLWKSIWSIISIKEKESFNKNKRYIKSQKEESNENIKTFLHEEGKEFEGIMRYLSKTSGSNIHDNGTIQITTNSIHGNNHPKNLVNYKTDNYYHSEDNKLATICFDFKNQPIQLTSYSIKSNGNSGKNNYDLKSWVIEVSNDGEKWEEIDRHDNDESLNGQDIIKTFDIQNPNKNFYRFIQLRQTGPSWNNHNRTIFWFYFIEFYGRMKCSSY